MSTIQTRSLLFQEPLGADCLPFLPWLILRTATTAPVKAISVPCPQEPLK